MLGEMNFWFVSCSRKAWQWSIVSASKLKDFGASNIWHMDSYWDKMVHLFKVSFCTCQFTWLKAILCQRRLEMFSGNEWLLRHTHLFANGAMSKSCANVSYKSSLTLKQNHLCHCFQKELIRKAISNKFATWTVNILSLLIIFLYLLSKLGSSYSQSSKSFTNSGTSNFLKFPTVSLLYCIQVMFNNASYQLFFLRSYNWFVSVCL